MKAQRIMSEVVAEKWSKKLERESCMRKCSKGKMQREQVELESGIRIESGDIIGGKKVALQQMSKERQNFEKVGCENK